MSTVGVTIGLSNCISEVIQKAEDAPTLKLDRNSYGHLQDCSTFYIHSDARAEGKNNSRIAFSRVISNKHLRRLQFVFILDNSWNSVNKDFY